MEGSDTVGLEKDKEFFNGLKVGLEEAIKLKKLQEYIPDIATIPMRDARIVFNREYPTDEINRVYITELEVGSFKKGEKEKWPKYLHAKYTSDIGNSIFDWDEWEPIDIVLDLFTKYEFKDFDTKLRAMKELAKIVELGVYIGGHIQQYLF